MTKVELSDRCSEFARGVYILMRIIPAKEESRYLSGQLLRSSMSVAANYRALLRAKSRKDFANKMKIVLEEADESHFWLTMLVSVDVLD